MSDNVLMTVNLLSLLIYQCLNLWFDCQNMCTK